MLRVSSAECGDINIAPSPTFSGPPAGLRRSDSERLRVLDINLHPDDGKRIAMFLRVEK